MGKMRGKEEYSRAGARSEPVVGVYHAHPEAYLDRIAQFVDKACLRVITSPDGLEEHVHDLDVLLAFKFPGQLFPKELIVSSPRLAWVQLASAGVDHIIPHERTDLVVTNASGIHGHTMAQFVIGALVSELFDFPRLRRQQEQRRWEKYEVGGLAGKTMGVIGAGHIGSAIGRAAKALGMRIIGTRRSAAPVEGFDRVVGPEGIPGILAESDVVVVTAPLTTETRGLIGAVEFAAMKHGATFVNVSRGGVVDEPPLLQALMEGRIRYAVIDVFEREPLSAASPFWFLENAFITPHISSEAQGWETAVAELFLENLGRFVRGEPLRNRVDPELGY